MAEDRSKLPKWAQMRIAQLESSVAYYKAQMQEMVGTEEGNPKEGPPIIADPYGEKLRLPRGTNVEFMLNEGGEDSITCGVAQLSIHGPWVLTARAKAGLSSTTLVIMPEACNTVRMRVKPLSGCF